MKRPRRRTGLRRLGSPRRAAKPMQREHGEQVYLFEWIRRGINPELAMAFAVPNGVRTSWSQATKLKASGLSAGVPDILLLSPNAQYHGLCIELKAKEKPAAVSGVQLDWLLRLGMRGYCAKVCYGADDAIVTIAEYLHLPKKEYEPWLGKTMPVKTVRSVSNRSSRPVSGSSS